MNTVLPIHDIKRGISMTESSAYIIYTEEISPHLELYFISCLP